MACYIVWVLALMSQAEETTLSYISKMAYIIRMLGTRKSTKVEEPGLEVGRNEGGQALVHLKIPLGC